MAKEENRAAALEVFFQFFSSYKCWLVLFKVIALLLFLFSRMKQWKNSAGSTLDCLHTGREKN